MPFDDEYTLVWSVSCSYIVGDGRSVIREAPTRRLNLVHEPRVVLGRRALQAGARVKPRGRTRALVVRAAATKVAVVNAGRRARSRRTALGRGVANARRGKSIPPDSVESADGS